jgi:hypothetical protein
LITCGVSPSDVGKEFHVKGSVIGVISPMVWAWRFVTRKRRVVSA